MKKYFKKFSIMFVILLVMIGSGTIKNETIATAATVGQQLLQPEPGWQRYDDTDSMISYSNSWAISNYNKDTNYNAYKETAHGNCGVVGSTIKFKFYGTKLRILTFKNPNNSGANVKIDDVNYGNFSNYSSSIGGCYIFFEKLDLSKTVHEVLITSIDRSVLGSQADASYFALDAIDIDDTGEQPIVTSGISLNKVTASLQIGQVDNLVATVIPYNATNKNVTWTSSDKSIATVDLTGKLTAIKEGKVIIKATTTDGSNLSASCTVNVTKKTEPPVQPTTSSAVVLSIEPENPKIHLKERVLTNLVIDNIKEIAAEEVKIKYDNTKLKFLGVNEI
ncbi:Ig-like domain-containing protein, partial [Clostridium puniceum]|uniref:Ig-like domain-containing protein n=1 Tax=Clostridium puniceum TaxID=29367 RepID=UPI00098C3F66